MHCILHPGLYHICRTYHRICTSTHTALRHRHDRHSGKQCDKCRVLGGKQRVLLEGLFQRICLQNSQRILRGKIADKRQQLQPSLQLCNAFFICSFISCQATNINFFQKGTCSSISTNNGLTYTLEGRNAIFL